MTNPTDSPADSTQAPPVELAPALRQMAGLVLSRESVDTALALVTTLAQTTIPGTIGAGVSLVDAHGKRSKAASNRAVEQADSLQYELDEGPCLTAWRSRKLGSIRNVSRRRFTNKWAFRRARSRSTRL